MTAAIALMSNHSQFDSWRAVTPTLAGALPPRPRPRAAVESPYEMCCERGGAPQPRRQAPGCGARAAPTVRVLRADRAPGAGRPTQRAPAV